MPPVSPVLIIRISRPARVLGRNKHTPASASPAVLRSSEAGGNVLKDLPGSGGRPRPRPPWGSLPRNRDQEGRRSQSTRVPDRTLPTPCDRKAPGTVSAGAFRSVPMGPWFTLSQGRQDSELYICRYKF